jgi:hypothetical protein
MNVKASRLFPRERENEPLVVDDLAIDAAEPVFAMRRRRDHRAVDTAERKSIVTSGQVKFVGPIQRFVCSGLTRVQRPERPVHRRDA